MPIELIGKAIGFKAGTKISEKIFKDNKKKSKDLRELEKLMDKSSNFTFLNGLFVLGVVLISIVIYHIFNIFWISLSLGIIGILAIFFYKGWKITKIQNEWRKNFIKEKGMKRFEELKKEV